MSADPEGTANITVFEASCPVTHVTAQYTARQVETLSSRDGYFPVVQCRHCPAKHYVGDLAQPYGLSAAHRERREDRP